MEVRGTTWGLDRRPVPTFVSSDRDKGVTNARLPFRRTPSTSPCYASCRESSLRGIPGLEPAAANPGVRQALAASGPGPTGSNLATPPGPYEDADGKADTTSGPAASQHGARGGIRTPDPCFTKAALYH